MTVIRAGRIVEEGPIERVLFAPAATTRVSCWLRSLTLRYRMAQIGSSEAPIQH